jgi:hypothetical protein
MSHKTAHIKKKLPTKNQKQKISYTHFAPQIPSEKSIYNRVANYAEALYLEIGMTC